MHYSSHKFRLMCVMFFAFAIISLSALYEQRYGSMTVSATSITTQPPAFTLGEKIKIGNQEFTTISSGDSLFVLADHASGSESSMAEAQAFIAKTPDTTNYGTLGSAYFHGKFTLPTTSDLTPIIDTSTNTLTTIPPLAYDWWLGDVSVNNRSKFVDSTNSLQKEMSYQVGSLVDNACSFETKIEQGVKPTTDQDGEIVVERLVNNTGKMVLKCEIIEGSNPGLRINGGSGSSNCKGREQTFDIRKGKIEYVLGLDWADGFIFHAVNGLGLEVKVGNSIEFPFEANVDLITGFRNWTPITPTSSGIARVSVLRLDGETEEITCPGSPQQVGTSYIRPLLAIPRTDILFAGSIAKSFVPSNMITGTFPETNPNDTNKSNLVLKNKDIGVSLTSGEQGVSGSKYQVALPSDHIISIPVSWIGEHEGKRYISASVNVNGTVHYGVLGELTSDQGSIELNLTNLADDIASVASISLTLYAEDSGIGSTAYMSEGTDITIYLDPISSISLTKNQAPVSEITYGDVQASEVLGTLTTTTISGQTSDGVYEFVDDVKGTNPSTTTNELEIVGSDIMVQNGKKLNAGEYTYYVKVTSTTGLEYIQSFQLKVKQRELHIETLIDSQNSNPITIDLNTTIPDPTTYSYQLKTGTFVDSLTELFYFENSTGAVVNNSDVSKQEGSYSLKIKFVTSDGQEDPNYNIIIDKTAMINVEVHSITKVNFTTSAPFTYGDTGTTSNDTIGILSIETDHHQDENNPTFQLCDSTGNVITYPEFAINGNQLNVAAGVFLHAKTYQLYVLAQSANQNIPAKVQQLNFVVNPFSITITPKDASTINKKAGESLSKFSAVYDVTPALLHQDTLNGTPVYTYDGAYSDYSTGSVPIKVQGISNDDYDITFASSTIQVTQRTLTSADYEISGTLNSDASWYQDHIRITMTDSAKQDGFDEFVDSNGQSLGNAITLTTPKQYVNYPIQLRNHTTNEITTISKESFSLDNVTPEYEVIASLPDGTLYHSGAATNEDITVRLNAKNQNISNVTYYMSETLASSVTVEDIQSGSIWKKLTSSTIVFDEYTNGPKTYTFVAMSGAELLGDLKTIDINNTKTQPNPSGLNWVSPANMVLYYGEQKSIDINMASLPVTYTILDDTGGTAAECLRIDETTRNIEAISGTCQSNTITLNAKVSNYEDELTKTVVVKKRPLTLETLYKDQTNFVDHVNIIKNDPEPLLKVMISASTSLAGGEANITEVADLGELSIEYSDSSGNTTTTLDTSKIGSYIVTPSFSTLKITDLNDKYDITWKHATIDINTINIAAKDLYEIKGPQKKAFAPWYTGPVNVTPIHNVYGNMKVDASADIYQNGTPFTESANGIHTHVLHFDDGSQDPDHVLTKTETIQIDDVIPLLEVVATSNQLPYLSGTKSEYEVEIEAVRQPVSAINISNARFFYTTDVNKKDTDPLDNTGALTNGWIEVNGNFLVSTSTTFYFKAVSGAGLVSNPLTYEVVIEKPNLNQTPNVTVTSEGLTYAADGHWTKHDITFTLSGSTTGYEVCMRNDTNINQCVWKDITNQSQGKHEIVSNVQNQTVWFRIKHSVYQYKETKPYLISLDVDQPTKPIITIEEHNANSLAKFLNYVTLGKFFNQEVKATIASSDALSGIDRIEYTLYDDQGTLITKANYTKPLPFNNAHYIIKAKAYDLAGNVSDESDPVTILVDTTPPTIEGIDDHATSYVPVSITMKDIGSGIDSDQSKIMLNGVSIPFQNQAIFTKEGTYHIEIIDVAGNSSIKEFQILPLPEYDAIGCDSDSKKLINEIRTSYEHIKPLLSTDEQKRYEEWLSYTDGFCIIQDSKKEVTVESLGEKIPDEVMLIKEDVTSSINQNVIELSDQEELKIVYDLYFEDSKGSQFYTLQNQSNMNVYLPMNGLSQDDIRVFEISPDGTSKEVKNWKTDDNGNIVIENVNVLKKFAISGAKNQPKKDVCVVGPDGKANSKDDVCGSDNSIKNEDGSVTVPDGGKVVFPDKEVNAPDGATINPDGSVDLPDGTHFDPDGNETKKPDPKPNPDDEKNDQVCVVGPDHKANSKDDVCGSDGSKKNEDGSVTVPDGGKVIFPDKEIDAPDGAIINPDGSVDLPDGTHFDPDGNQTKNPDKKPNPDDGQKPDDNNGSTDDNRVCSVGPDGKQNTSDDVCGTPNENGDKPVINPDGSITVPDGGSVIFPDGSEVELPDGGTIKPDGSVELPDGTIYDKDGNKKEPDQKKECKIKDSTLNVDTDDNGIPDINLDLDGDCYPDINIDVDGDNIPDVNIDTTGDGKPNINSDINNDGIPDLNMTTITSWKPNLKANVNGFAYETMSNITSDKNIDTDGDGYPDENVDDDWYTSRGIEKSGSSVKGSYNNSSKNTGGVSTGDHTKWTIWWILMIATASMMGYSFYRKRKKKF